VRGAGVHRVIAAAIMRGAEDKGYGTDSDAALAFLRSLQDESELAALFGNGLVADSITEMLWPEVLKMQAAAAATTNEVMTKFAGATELSFGGLDKFFGGLEGALPLRSRPLHAPARALRPSRAYARARAVTHRMYARGDGLMTVRQASRAGRTPRCMRAWRRITYKDLTQPTILRRGLC